MGIFFFCKNCFSFGESKQVLTIEYTQILHCLLWKRKEKKNEAVFCNVKCKN